MIYYGLCAVKPLLMVTVLGAAPQHQHHHLTCPPDRQVLDSHRELRSLMCTVHSRVCTPMRTESEATPGVTGDRAQVVTRAVGRGWKQMKLHLFTCLSPPAAPGPWPRGWGPPFQMALKARKIADHCANVCVCARVRAKLIHLYICFLLYLVTRTHLST